MDPDAPMILPKGIVVNSSAVYTEVASFSVVPSQKVREYWNVYTTTYKKLKDPTSCRLENFWWHVWGSNRKSLNGSTLAKLFEHISVGSTVVPLKGPPNRWEGPELNPDVQQPADVSPPEPIESRPTKPRQSSKSSSKGLRVLSSSASKPPPAHPILKKAGSSSSGPKPTARFVSPPQSDDEDEVPSSGSTAATASDAPVYVPPSPKKKSAHLAKKRVASKASKKRRAIPRRQSSDHGSREAGPSTGPRYVAQPSVNPIPEDPSEQAQPSVDPILEDHILEDPSEETPSAEEPAESGSREPSLSAKLRQIVPLATPIIDLYEDFSERSDIDISPTSQNPPTMSKKARGKQPAFPQRPITQLNTQLNKLAKPPTFAGSRPGPSPVQAPTLNLQAGSLVDLHGQAKRRGSATSRSPLTIGSLQSSSGSETHIMSRSKSFGSESYKSLNQNLGRGVLPAGLVSTATASTSMIDATGTILDQSGTSAVPEPKMALEKRPSHHSITIEPTRSVLDARFTPTPPTNSVSMPLGRTKSQLTLLLEREKARERGEPESNI